MNTIDLLTRAVAAAAILAAGGCGKDRPAGGVTPQQLTDALYAVLAADRAVYTEKVVARLQDEEGVIKASEHYPDDKALPLPAQMFRMGAERVQKQSLGFTYALLSPWPINKQNLPRTEEERAGLHDVATSGKAHYGEETLGGQRYFTAVYADRAVSAACVGCHNGHRDSPRHDFKLGETMGAVVIRVALP